MPAQVREGIDPLRLIIETRDENEFPTPGLLKRLAPAYPDFLQRLDAVGDECGAGNQQSFYTLRSQLLQRGVGIGFDPFRAAQPRLERHGPLRRRDTQCSRKALTGPDALRTVTVIQHGALCALATVRAAKAMCVRWVGLANVALRQSVVTQQ